MVNRACCKMAFAGLGLLVLGAALCGVGSCGGAPTPFVVNGPGGVGNEPPTLTIETPSANFDVAQGVSFIISWNDQDRDNNASITFELVNTATNSVVILVSGIPENDTGSADSQTVDTGLVPVGSYNLLGIINDGVNSPVTTYALVEGSATQRVVVNVVGAGQGPLTQPPTVAVIEPRFDRSVTQGDAVTILVRPTANSPEPPLANSPPYDPDTDTTIFIVLDRDQDPDNDDPFNPDAGQIIVVATGAALAGTNAQQQFDLTIDLTTVPPNPSGDPYFVRATITDGQNPSVSSYAPGTLNVVQLASGTVDLFNVGRTVSGAKFQGFSPKANLGSKVRGVSDFDADGTDDFVMVAQFGNPQNAGPVGEAYLLYGKDGIRLGGTASVNSIGQPFDPTPNVQPLSGVIFAAPAVRSSVIDYPGRTDGITDVDFVRDLTADGRPEILFGFAHVHGAFDSTDFDPADESTQDLVPDFCYPDLLVNNFTDGGATRLGLSDIGFYAGGMGVMINSQNRDNAGTLNANRLESTTIDLELVGQLQGIILDVGGVNDFGNILARASNEFTPDAQLGNDTEEPARISGARFVGGFFDWVHQLEPPREDLFASTISSLGDLNSDGLDEIIVSSPRNERYYRDIVDSQFFSQQLASSSHFGSITVFPGQNYNLETARDIDDETGTSVTPFLDQWEFPPFGSCDPDNQNESPRHLVVHAQTFEIFAENIDDFLGGGKSAGDFNQDGLDDILASAPKNDNSNALDTGAAYVIYGRQVMGEVHLSFADDPVLRTPMLRVRGVHRGDQLGLKTAAGLDVNGDRIDDIFVSSARTDFGGVTRAQCTADFNGDGVANTDDLSIAAFSDCQTRFGESVFSSDACKAFDYDNDSDIDDEDRCVFCCLSGSCTVEASCINGKNDANCCENMVDNGFVGVIFGGRTIDGDRSISQIATTDLPGVVFYGGHANDLAGWDISSAGDFNQDGFGDILIAAPGEVRRDSAGRERLGAVYLIFGGTHLSNTQWNLSDLDRGVGTDALPGIVFVSPFVTGRPNEAAPMAVGLIGDINNDGFDDIAIGNPKADFIDLTFPQGPNAPGDDAAAGRRSDAGEVYIIYGNNFGSNR